MPDKLMSDEQAAELSRLQDVARAAVAANPGAVPDFNALAADPAAMQAFVDGEQTDADRLNRIAQHGVEARGTIRSVALTGAADLGGGRGVEVVVVLQDGTETVVHQQIPQAHIERLVAGHPVTVKHDPEAPGSALLIDW